MTRHDALTERCIRPVHPFPARMAPSIVLDGLAEARGTLKVLDPMSGSGTTLVAARALGHEVIGFDTDPLAILLSRAWCSAVDTHRIMQIAKRTQEAAERSVRTLRTDKAFPITADDATRKFIRFWYDTRNRRELMALAGAIQRRRNADVRTVLWTAFSRMIVTKVSGVSLAMDVPHSRPHKTYTVAPVRPLNKFLEAAKTVCNALPFAGQPDRTAVHIELGDARALPISDKSINAVITSPPYLNAIDYIRGHRLSLVWMGYNLEQLSGIRSSNIGTEAAGRPDAVASQTLAQAKKAIGSLDRLKPRFQLMVERYLKDMEAVIAEIYRVLVPGGTATLVIGNSNLRGVFLQNSKAITQMGIDRGFQLQSATRRVLPPNRRYLPPPSSSIAGTMLQSRMAEETVLRFVK